MNNIKNTSNVILNVKSIIVIIIIIIIIIILVTTSMQGIYIYIPETNHVSRVHRVGAVLYLQFVLYVMLLRPWNMFIIIVIIIIMALNVDFSRCLTEMHF
jgi:hypothetical protein